MVLTVVMTLRGSCAYNFKHGKGLDEKMAHISPLTTQHAERLREMMTEWWCGGSLARIAQAHGVSRQRVHQLLNSVDCVDHAHRWRKVTLQNDERHHRHSDVIEARAIMESDAWPCLTAKQRAVVAWLSIGLGVKAIAGRMGVSPSGVDNHFDAARLRVLWLRMRLSDSSLEESDAAPEMNPPGWPVCSKTSGAVDGRAEPAVDTLPSAEESDTGEPDVSEEPMPGDSDPASLSDEPERATNDPVSPEKTASIPEISEAPSSPPEISAADFAPPNAENRPLRLSELLKQKRGTRRTWNRIWPPEDWGPLTLDDMRRIQNGGTANADR